MEPLRTTCDAHTIHNLQELGSLAGMTNVVSAPSLPVGSNGEILEYWIDMCGPSQAAIINAAYPNDVAKVNRVLDILETLARNEWNTDEFAKLSQKEQLLEHYATASAASRGADVKPFAGLSEEQLMSMWYATPEQCTAMEGIRAHTSEWFSAACVGIGMLGRSSKFSELA